MMEKAIILLTALLAIPLVLFFLFFWNFRSRPIKQIGNLLGFALFVIGAFGSVATYVGGYVGGKINLTPFLPSVISFLLPVIFIFLGVLLILLSRNTPADDEKLFKFDELISEEIYAKTQCEGFLLDAIRFSEKNKKKLMPLLLKRWKILKRISEKPYYGIYGFLTVEKNRKVLMELNEEFRNLYKKHFKFTKESFDKRYTDEFKLSIHRDLGFYEGGIKFFNRKKEYFNELYKKYKI
jgi:hypothetical protein|tara:strand:- start:595 stop:1308 length:714 start_codon:yes stop_codon:yes gene_type:complete